MNINFDLLKEKIRNREPNIFDNFILIIITLSSVMVGFETVKELSVSYSSFFYIFEIIILSIFVFEIFFKMYVFMPKPWHYFMDGWNIFDFTIVVISLLPFVLHNSINTEGIIVLRILRLARVFRVFRFISVLKPLQMLVSTLLRSLPSMSYVALLILILFYVYGVIGVFLFQHTDPEHYSSLSLSILTLFQTITGEGWPDLLSTQMQSGNSLAASIFYITFIVIGSMIILNLFIGVIVSELENLKEVDARGKESIDESGHILILGWSNKLNYLISELNEANIDKKNTVIVILSEYNKFFVDEYFQSNNLYAKNINYIFRTGHPFEQNDLKMVSIKSSKSIIILDNNVENPDSYVIKVLLSVVNHIGNNNSQITTLPITELKNEELIKLIKAENLFSVPVDDIISRIIAQSCRQSGLSSVYNEMLSFEGNEIYSKQIKQLTGKSFETAYNSFKNACVIGIRTNDDNIIINPDKNYILRDKDEILALAENESSLLPNYSYNSKADVEQIDTMPVKISERTLIVGFNRRIHRIIEELNSYSDENSEVVIVSKYNDYFQKENCEHCNIKLNGFYADTESRSELEKYVADNFSHIIILSYSDNMSQEEADSSTIITLLYIRDILKRSGKRIPIVTEMLNNKNEELAHVTSDDDFIISDKLDSLLLAQFSQNPYLKKVYDNLFDDKGCEIYLKEAELFFDLKSVYKIAEVANVMLNNRMMFIGYKTTQQDKTEVNLNPDKDAEITFNTHDKIIVISEK